MLPCRHINYLYETEVRFYMIIIADMRLPAVALDGLRSHGQVLGLGSTGITYDSIAGHPDIFYCQAGPHLVYAPNAPAQLTMKLHEAGLNMIRGQQPVGREYPYTAAYNAVITGKYLIHNLRYTDTQLKKISVDREPIHVSQAYTRCNVVSLPGERFITSDRGIEKILLKHQLEVLYVQPDGILLPGHPHGFIGGTCGKSGHRIFFAGRLELHRDGKRIRDFLGGMEVIELYDGPLFDGGSILMLQLPGLEQPVVDNKRES